MDTIHDPRAIDLRTLFSQFESLGNNCEIGIVQEACGCTGPALFKNVGFNNTEQIINGLQAGFEGMFDEGNYAFVKPEGWSDYALNCNRFGFLFHTAVPVAENHPVEQLQNRVVSFRYMKAKLLEDLRLGEKVFTYRHKTEVEVSLAQRLFAAVRRHGPGWLLYVREDLRPESRFGWIAHSGQPGLLFAGNPVLSNENPPLINFSAWEKIARQALMLKQGVTPLPCPPDDGLPDPPPGMTDITTHRVLGADPVFSLTLAGSAGTTYTAQTWLWIPSGFDGQSIDLMMAGYFSESFVPVDLARRDQWQMISVTARIPEDMSHLVPTIRASPGAHGVLHTSGWTVRPEPTTSEFAPASVAEEEAALNFTRQSRTDVDAVEGSFVKYKNANPEQLEYLVPVLQASPEYSPRPLSHHELTEAELAQARAYATWGYQFDLSPSVSTVMIDAEAIGYTPPPIGRHEHLIEMTMLQYALRFFALEGPWLDLATNSGVIPLMLGRNGTQRIVGVDINPLNIEKAHFLKALSGYEQAEFRTGDVYATLPAEPDHTYDLISALGLFYHLSDPLGLLSLMYQKTRRAVLIDTVVHNFPFSGWLQTVSRHVKFTELAHANDTRKIFEFHPTYRGLLDSFFQVGFGHVFEIVPTPELLAKYPGTIYDSRNRRQFIAIKD